MRPLSAATFDTIPPEIRVMIYGEHILESLKQPYINVNAILPYIRDESITSVSRGEIAGTIQKYVGKKTVWNVESENSLKAIQNIKQFSHYVRHYGLNVNCRLEIRRVYLGDRSDYTQLNAVYDLLTKLPQVLRSLLPPSALTFDPAFGEWWLQLRGQRLAGLLEADFMFRYGSSYGGAYIEGKPNTFVFRRSLIDEPFWGLSVEVDDDDFFNSSIEGRVAMPEWKKLD